MTELLILSALAVIVCVTVLMLAALVVRQSASAVKVLGKINKQHSKFIVEIVAKEARRQDELNNRLMKMIGIQYDVQQKWNNLSIDSAADRNQKEELLEPLEENEKISDFDAMPYLPQDLIDQVNGEEITGVSAIESDLSIILDAADVPIVNSGSNIDELLE